MRTMLSGLKAHERFSVSESSQVGSLRRAVSALARGQGMGQEQAARAAIMATEMGTNLVKHAHGGGEVLVRSISGGTGGLELLSLDKGPGMENPARMLQDGVSTTGSPGTGLGALAVLVCRQRRSEGAAVHEVARELLFQIEPVGHHHQPAGLEAVVQQQRPG